MAKLSKAEWKAHEEAKRILTKDTLSHDEKLYVLENWHESATNDNARLGAFFTPMALAIDLREQHQYVPSQRPDGRWPLGPA